MSTSNIIVNGWHLFAHSLFIDQYQALVAEVEKLRKKHPHTYKNKNLTKRLAAITKLAFDKIPQDPASPEYRQGTTLGDEYKHWFRAKFFQQYRLFFRYHSDSKIIVYAWVNDEHTKRAYLAKTDAYRVFKEMLHSGNPPDTWNELLAEAKKNNERFLRIRRE